MNKFYLVTLTAVVLTAFSSCGGSDKEEQKTRYEGLSSEKVKEQLQTDALEFVTQIEGLPDEPAVKTLEVFNELLSISSPTLRSGKLRSVDDIISINDFNGKFDWDASKKAWVISELAGKAEFNFPSSVSGKTNTEKILVEGVESEYSYTETETDWNYIGWDDELGPIYEEEEYVTEYKLPASLNATIYSGGNKSGDIALKATYTNADMPLKTADVAYTIGSYAFTLKANNASPVVLSATFKKGGLTLLNLSAEATGGNITESEYPDNVKVSMPLIDRIAFSGTANLKEYIPASQKIEEEYEELGWYESLLNGNSKQYNEKMCAAFNQYIKIGLNDAEGTLIANLEMKAVLDEDYEETYYYDEYYGKWWDPVKGEHVSEKPQYNFESWYSVPVLRFADGSAVEASVYFSKGFDQVIQKIKSIIDCYGWD